ncbi:MAG: OsmC family protein [Thermodesulfobacteriota bacterium]|nr:OsmC family protein [Thermodesulfobacteriota bacterium]
MSENEMYYHANVQWKEGQTGDLVLDGKPDLPVSVPVEFGGPEDMTSPEDLFVSAAVVCLMTTFLNLSAKIRAEWESFSCSGKAKLELIPKEGYLFTQMDLYPKVTVKSGENIPAVEKALELAKKYCPVTRSMTVEAKMHPEVTVA